MLGKDVFKDGKSGIGLTQSASDLGGVVVGGKRKNEDPDFWDDFNGDPALESAREMGLLAAILQDRLSSLEQIQQNQTDRDSGRSEAITQKLRNFARKLLESSQRIVGCAGLVDVDGFLSEVKIILSYVEGVRFMFEVALAGRDLTPLQLAVSEALTPLHETLQYTSKQLIENVEEDMFQAAENIECEVEVVLEVIGQLDFSSESHQITSQPNLQWLVARALALEATEDGDALGAKLLQRLGRRLNAEGSEDLQAAIARLEADSEFQKGWGDILEKQKERDRIVKKEVEKYTIFILRQVLSKLGILSTLFRDQTDVWFSLPEQLTNATDRKAYIESYNEIIELLTWAVFLAKSLATIDPEDETYKQTFNMLQKLRQQREQIKKELDFFELLDDVYDAEFHKNLNRIANALMTSVDVKYRSDIEEPDWLARIHIANKRPL